jgi:antitoxin component YwqK of YwqJK toxin-antitoxin module
MASARTAVSACIASILALACGLVASAPSLAQLVPVSKKEAMAWGQPGGVVAEQPGALDQLEELPAPTDAVAIDMATLRQEKNLAADDPGNGEPSSFEGLTTEIIRQRHPDGSVQVERYVTQDEAGNFLNHGPWTLFTPAGAVLARGEFRHGRMSGAWHRWHPATGEGVFAEPLFTEFRGPFLSVCEFRDGQPHGNWTIMDQQRRKILEIPYREGRRHGVATWYWPDGKRLRQVSFSAGELDGDLIEWDRNEQVTRRASYDGNRELITRTGWFVPNQKRVEDHFLGPQIEFTGADDWWNAMPASFAVDGEEVRHGPSSEWYRNGQLKMRGLYRYGLRQGEFVWWHDNGQRQTAGEYIDNRKQGQWNWWHANGALAVTGSFEDDRAVGQWSWFTDTGELQHSETMDGQLQLEELEGSVLPDESADTGAPASEPPALMAPSGPTLDADFGLAIPDPAANK